MSRVKGIVDGALSRVAALLSVLVFALGAVPAFAQTLDLGSVTVSLGMTRQQTLSLFSGVRYTVLDPTTTKLMLITDSDYKHTYLVQFTNGRLTYASRSWASTYENGLEDAIKALSALAQKSATLCSVSHEPLSEPDSAADRLFVKCGQRGVLMYKGKVNGLSNMYGVNEFIGDSH